MTWLRYVFLLGTVVHGATAEVQTTPVFYEQSIRPALTQYCLGCHSTEKQKGELDLEQFSSLDLIRKQPQVWQNVVDQLGSLEMPPKDKPQPSSEQRAQLIKWAQAVLAEIALAQAGDPGPVVLRRLSNAEYTYTIRDLTGVQTIDPAREFPVDGAAGEGFMNVGNALVMSPSLITKYLDAAKDITTHAVLLPHGLKFSSKTTRRDWTEEILHEIRDFYRGFTDPRGGDKVNLQGIIFETNEGGRLPLEKYLAATLELRDQPDRGATAIAALASKKGLSPKYLQLLMTALTTADQSMVLNGIRDRWLASAASSNDVAVLANEIGQWQKALWKFSSVGHIGKAGGPKAWMEPVDPLVTRQETRLKLTPPASAQEVVLYLVAGDAGDGSDNDFVVWQQPRFVSAGRRDLLLRDLPLLWQRLNARRERVFATAAAALEAAAELSRAGRGAELSALAEQHGVDRDVLQAWCDYLGIGSNEVVKIDSYFTTTTKGASGYDFINGWGSSSTPNLVANSSSQHVRIPGNMKPHSVAVHPSPTRQAAAGWRSTITGRVRVEAEIQHAHPECGNGVTWTVELRHGARRQRLGSGVAQGGGGVKMAAVENIPVQPGDLISLLVGPRSGNHSCDLTAIDLRIKSSGDDAREWDLAKDTSPDILAGNPHPDRFGTSNVWHFYTEADKGADDSGPVIPAGSVLARWQSADGEEKGQWARSVQALLIGGAAKADQPDAKLYAQLASLGGPLFSGMLNADPALPAEPTPDASHDWGLPAQRFGTLPKGSIDPASLGVRAPSILEIRLPADLISGYEFVTAGALDPLSGAEGSVQLQVRTNPPPRQGGLVPSEVKVTDANGQWTSNNQRVSYGVPIITHESSSARRRIETGMEKFREVFPAALCYSKIVPVDEVVTLTLYYREDHQLARLMLTDHDQAKLNRLWDELHFVSHDALTLVDAYDQLWQFATQDADPKVFEPLREPIRQRAATFKQALRAAEPEHVDAVLRFAEEAYRRPLNAAEQDELRQLYHGLRGEEIPHEEAIRLALARILVAPGFLYRAEKPTPGAKPGRVSGWELANRLSYFLWSSAPDAALRRAAATDALSDPDVLWSHTRRMLRDAKARRLATEFACAWLHIYAFDELGEKSDRHFPTFTSLRGDMYEESIRFFTDFFQENRSILEILDADHGFVNESLARHYGIPGVTGTDWRRVDGLKKFSRGGILGHATTLTKHSGASRTSPILRGNWVSEVLLGEKLPRPPKDVPPLPEDEATETLTVRQLTERHTQDPRCAGCHARIDAFGFALENFDAIGRRRERDLGDRPIDTRAKVADGSEFDGMAGLRDYLLTKRRDAFVRQFCRKLLGYSLGRAVQLSDTPLLNEMSTQLAANDYRVGVAIEAIVRSPQFRDIRGVETAYNE